MWLKKMWGMIIAMSRGKMALSKSTSLTHHFLSNAASIDPASFGE